LHFSLRFSREQNWQRSSQDKIHLLRFHLHVHPMHFRKGSNVCNIGTLIFDTWINTNSNNPTSLLNQDAAIRQISDDIYIDIKFTSFSDGGSAGGFTYERSTN